jgi:hypothetical protein
VCSTPFKDQLAAVSPNALTRAFYPASNSNPAVVNPVSKNSDVMPVTR